MKKAIPISDLDRWKKNYAAPANKTLGAGTNSAVISLEVLQGFIDEAKANCTGFSGVRIYFIRYDRPNDNLKANTDYANDMYKYVEEIGNSGFSQVSLAFVPVVNFDPVTLAGKDFEDGSNIFTLSICHPADWLPGSAAETGTGLCPPKCHT